MNCLQTCGFSFSETLGPKARASREANFAAHQSQAMGIVGSFYNQISSTSAKSGKDIGIGKAIDASYSGNSRLVTIPNNCIFNGLLGLWWADPAAAMIMIPIQEGIEGIKGKNCECS